VVTEHKQSLHMHKKKSPNAIYVDIADSSTVHHYIVEFGNNDQLETS